MYAPTVLNFRRQVPLRRLLMWRIGVFGLCWLAVLLPADGGATASILFEAVVRHGLSAQVNIWTMSPGAQFGGTLYPAAIVALALSRPLVASQTTSLAHLAGMGLAFWFFPFVAGPLYHGNRILGAPYVSNACDAMLVGAFAAELLVGLACNAFSRLPKQMARLAHGTTARNHPVATREGLSNGESRIRKPSA